MRVNAKMNNETRIDARAAGAPQECRGLEQPARVTRLPAPQAKRREGLFAPLAAFASLAGSAGLPFISL
jgi:hypothetical protein